MLTDDFKITNEIKKELFDRFSSIDVSFKERFNGFPEGNYTSHSWAGESGGSVKITPLFIYNKKLLIGETWGNNVVEYSENGRCDGSSDKRKNVRDFSENYLLLGYVYEIETLSYNEVYNPDIGMVIYKNVSTCGELTKEQYDKEFKIWCEKMEKELHKPESKEVTI